MFPLSESIMKNGYECSNHLFSIGCSTLNSRKRIAQVAFCIISLGVVVYYAVSYLVSRVSVFKLKSSQSEPTLEERSHQSGGMKLRTKNLAHDTGLSVPGGGYEFIDQEVMEFALQNIESFPPCVFKNRNPDMPELGEVLARLMTKFKGCEKKFLDLLEEKPIAKEEELNDPSKNPLLDEDVIAIADDYIKLAYAVSIKTFEELPEFIKEAREKGSIFESKAEALMQQGAYQHKTYFYLPIAFHDLRGCLVSRQISNRFKSLRRINVAQGNENHRKLLEEHIAKFYQSGTKQSKWRELFNGYCEYVRAQVGGEEAFQEDSRFVQWIQKVPDQIQWESSRYRKGLLFDKFITPKTTPT